MERGHDFDAAKILELAAHAGDSFARFQQVAQCGVSHYNDYIWLNGGNFPKQKWATDGGFLKCRLAIARRPAAIDIAD